MKHRRKHFKAQQMYILREQSNTIQLGLHNAETIAVYLTESAFTIAI